MVPNDTSHARTTQKSLRLLEALLDRDTAGITELSEELGMSKSTVHNHLNTLRECGYVVKQDNTYRVGLKFLEIGGYTRSRMDLYQNARAKVAKLQEKTGEAIYLSTEEEGQGVVLIEAGKISTETEWYTGKRFSLFEVTEGKVILAGIPEDRRKEIYTKHFDGSITDLEEELATIRADGYAIETATEVGETWRVAVPIHGEDGSVLGTISLADRHDSDIGTSKDDVIQVLIDTADRIEQKLDLAWYDSESVVTPKHSLSSYGDIRSGQHQDEDSNL